MCCLKTQMINGADPMYTLGKQTFIKLGMKPEVLQEIDECWMKGQWPSRNAFCMHAILVKCRHGDADFLTSVQPRKKRGKYKKRKKE